MFKDALILYRVIIKVGVKRAIKEMDKKYSP